MEDIKRLFRNSLIAATFFLALGLILWDRSIVALSIGMYASVLSLYSITLDARKLPYLKNEKEAKSWARRGYIKRYAFYFIILAIAGKFFDENVLLATTLGLFNVRLNIYVMLLHDKIKQKFKGGHKK